MAWRPYLVPPALVLSAVALLGLGRAAAADGRVAWVAREVARIEIEVPSAPARAGTDVPITVRVLDGAGVPVDAERVGIDCQVGRVTGLTRAGEGLHRATLTVPRLLPHGRSAVLFANADGRGSERTLDLAPGPASFVEISGPATVARRYGDHLAVSILDDFGNRADEEPSAHAGAGSLAVTRIETGLWTVVYPPRPDVEAPEVLDEVVVVAGAARGSRTVRVTPEARRFSFAPWMGAALGEVTGLAAGATASTWWIVGADSLGVGVDAGFWRHAERSTVSLPGAQAALSTSRSVLPITSSFAWGHALTRRLAATLAVGAGVALVQASEGLSGQPAVDERGWAPAASLALELGYRVAGSGAAFLQARGTWTGDAHLTTVTGASTAVLLVGGYRFDAR